MACGWVFEESREGPGGHQLLLGVTHSHRHRLSTSDNTETLQEAVLLPWCPGEGGRSGRSPSHHTHLQTTQHGYHTHTTPHADVHHGLNYTPPHCHGHRSEGEPPTRWPGHPPAAGPGHQVKTDSRRCEMFSAQKPRFTRFEDENKFYSSCPPSGSELL